MPLCTEQNQVLSFEFKIITTAPLPFFLTFQSFDFSHYSFFAPCHPGANCSHLLIAVFHSLTATAALRVTVTMLVTRTDKQLGQTRTRPAGSDARAPVSAAAGTVVTAVTAAVTVVTAVTAVTAAARES